jgi:hypothetical protein
VGDSDEILEQLVGVARPDFRARLVSDQQDRQPDQLKVVVAKCSARSAVRSACLACPPAGPLTRSALLPKA